MIHNNFTIISIIFMMRFISGIFILLFIVLHLLALIMLSFLLLCYLLTIIVKQKIPAIFDSQNLLTFSCNKNMCHFIFIFILILLRHKLRRLYFLEEMYSLEMCYYCDFYVIFRNMKPFLLSIGDGALNLHCCNLSYYLLIHKRYYLVFIFSYIYFYYSAGS